MSTKKEHSSENQETSEGMATEIPQAPVKPKTCFIIMPISDQEGYEPGHFGRVYMHIIKPACVKAGFVPIRADEVSGTNMIVIDILQKIINSDMAVCDLSSRNPNVFYELGIRQSFDLPVTLIKDEVTPRVFDIQGFRDVAYNKSMRFDLVTDAVERLSASMKETFANKDKKGEHKNREVNSIIDLLGITKASVKEPVKISSDTEVLLNAIKDISSRLPVSTSIQPRNSVVLRKPVLFAGAPNPVKSITRVTLANGDEIIIGNRVISETYGSGIVEVFDRKAGEIFLGIHFVGIEEIIFLPSTSPHLSGDPSNLPF